MLYDELCESFQVSKINLKVPNSSNQSDSLKMCSHKIKN